MKQARKQDLSTRPVLQVIALLACCLGFGCAGYKLGPTSGQVAGQRSVEILPIQNLTPEPRLTDAFDGALRRAIQHDGTFRLETRDEGDLIVSGVITHFQRSYLSFDPRDVITPRDYQLMATMQLKVTEKAGSKVLMSKDISGRTTVRVGADVASAERQAIPLIGEILARRATSALADGDWP